VHAPVKVITVEREFGSRGGEFAHDLARHLGWRLLDSELVENAARMAGVDPKLAASLDERLDPWYYRYGKVFWQDPVYAPSPSGEEHVVDSQRMLELIQQQILDAAKEGNCVLVGRGSACALAGQPAPGRIGSRINFRIRLKWRSSNWRRSTGAAPRSSASSTSRSGARAGFITCS
jgi:hypothetical protein